MKFECRCPLEEFGVKSPTTAELHCFGSKFALSVPMADSWLLSLVKLIIKCYKLMKTYAESVNNGVVYSLAFGYSEGVFYAMKNSLANALGGGSDNGSDLVELDNTD